MLVGARGVSSSQVQQVGDGLQRIVDFVGNRGRQTARGGHFFAALQRLFRANLGSDVARDRRGADHDALAVAQGRDRKHHTHQRAVFSTAFGLVAFDRLTFRQTIEVGAAFVDALGRNRDQNRLAEHLVGAISV